MKRNKLLPLVTSLLFPLVQSSCPYLKSDIHEDNERDLSVLTEMSDVLKALGVPETDIKFFNINEKESSESKDWSVDDPEMIEQEEVDVTLQQSDFDNGTFIISKPGRYSLGEDITFRPNSLGDGEVTPEAVMSCCEPRPEQFKSNGGIYDDLNYAIGFISAISVESSNVEIDLNGFTIEQSAEHALMMRFFAVIQLNSRIHPVRQGAFFGGIPGAPDPLAQINGTSGTVDAGEFLTANNVLIHNGRIGRSSHHGIIGNNNTVVTVRNVEFMDFEVAAMALNGVQQATIENCVATNNREDSPVLGGFSHAYQMHRYLEAYESVVPDTTLTIQGQKKTIGQVKDELATAVANVYEDVVRGKGFINRREHLVEHKLFNNEEGVIDSNVYGFVLNKEGVAVFGFPTIVGDKFYSELLFGPKNAFPNPARNIIMSNVKVESLKGNFIETPTLNTANRFTFSDGRPNPDNVLRSVASVSDANSGMVQILNRDRVTGELLTISSDDFEEAEYIGNVFSNAQLMVGKAEEDGGHDLFSPSDQLRIPRGNNIRSEVLQWVEAGGTTNEEAKLSNLLAKLSGGTGQTPFFCNVDVMAHAPKGVNAINLFTVVSAEMTNVSVGTLTSVAPPNTDLCGDYNFTFNNPMSTLTGFCGSDVRSFAFAGSKDVKASNLSIGEGGDGENVIGVDFMTDSRDIDVSGLNVANAVGGSAFVFSPVAVRNTVRNCLACRSAKPSLFPRVRCGVRSVFAARRNTVGLGCATPTNSPGKSSKPPKKRGA